MSKFKVDFAGFEEVRAKLNKLDADTESIAIKALNRTNEIVRDAAYAAIQKPNLPAGGEYSQGRSEKALRDAPLIEKQGTKIIAHIGFDLKRGGLTTIWLMYGTPKMAKVQKLYDAFYNQEEKIMKAQREEFLNALAFYEKL